MKTIKVIAALAGVVLLAGCDQIPSFDAKDREVNAQACESISQAWESITGTLSGSDPTAALTGIAEIPQLIEQAGATATDKQLTEALGQLKSVADELVASGQPDLAALGSATVGIAGRCAILGTPINLEIPAQG